MPHSRPWRSPYVCKHIPAKFEPPPHPLNLLNRYSMHFLRKGGFPKWWVFVESLHSFPPPPKKKKSDEKAKFGMIGPKLAVLILPQYHHVNAGKVGSEIGYWFGMSQFRPIPRNCPTTKVRAKQSWNQQIFPAKRSPITKALTFSAWHAAQALTAALFCE